MSFVNRWVKQEDAHGCGLAVLAMLTGQTYQAVKQDFLRYAKRWEANHFESRGINYLQMETYLANKGYAVARKCQYDSISNRKRRVFPPKKLGAVNYAEVEQFTGNWHFIVVLGSGLILDPLTSETKDFVDYKRVALISEVIKLS